MDIGTISIRYAKALLKYAIDGHVEDKVYEDMKMLASVYLHAPELRYMTENPLLSDEARMEVLCKACGDDVSQATKNFFSLVIKKRRTEFIQFLANAYISLYLKEKKVVKSHLTVPVSVDDATITRMKDIIGHYVGSKECEQVDMDVEVDPSIVGGFILDFGTYRLDASINRQIDNIKLNLLRTADNA